MSSEVPRARPTYRGQALYSPGLLWSYDPVVLRFLNRYCWRCPTSRLLTLYNENVSERHLDVGPGSGYFLDNCRFPVAQPDITLVDLNINPLRHTARRIERYHPRLHQANILAPLDLADADFRSVGINYVLHCLPGSIDTKSIVFRNLKSILSPGAVVFGSTILASGVNHTSFPRRLIRLNNKIGVFTNLADDRAGLERILCDEFATHQIEVQGSVAIFVAHTAT